MDPKTCPLLSPPHVIMEAQPSTHLDGDHADLPAHQDAIILQRGHVGLLELGEGGH